METIKGFKDLLVNLKAYGKIYTYDRSIWWQGVIDGFLYSKNITTEEASILLKQLHKQLNFKEAN